jgi:predicted transcriptional regulator
VTATEIGDAFDIDRATAKRRLDALLDAGRVGRKEVGARAVVWWPVESNE